MVLIHYIPQQSRSIMIIKKGDFSDPQVQDLIRIHLHSMHQNTPIEHSFALDFSSLQKDLIRFYTLWRDDQLLGCGAIQELTTLSC